MEFSTSFTDQFMTFVDKGHWMHLYLLSCAWSLLVATFFIVGARMMATSHPEENKLALFALVCALVFLPGVNFLLPAAGILVFVIYYIGAFYKWWYLLYLTVAALFFYSFYYFY